VTYTIVEYPQTNPKETVWRYGDTRDTYQQHQQQEKSELKEYARGKETPVLPPPFLLSQQRFDWKIYQRQI